LVVRLIEKSESVAFNVTRALGTGR
jgi:hypothetical protein